MLRHDVLIPISRSSLRGSAKGVMLAIAIRAYEDCFEAHLTVGMLADEAGYSSRTTQEAVLKLEELGLIEVVRGWGRGAYNIYRVIYEKVRNLHPLEGDEQKNLPDEKGAKNSVKGADFSGKGADFAPYKRNKINKNIRAREGARETLPPRTGPDGPAAKVTKKAPAVNRAKGAGRSPGGRDRERLPDFHGTADTEARKVWRKCLQGKTAVFCIPQTALLGPIERGKATIFNLTGFERDQIIQNSGEFTLAKTLTKLTGGKIQLVLLKKEKAA